MRKEAGRWLRQAEADLKAAEDSMAAGNNEWCCFQSQQAAEKALKAYLYGLGYTSLTTHSIKMLAKRAGQKQDAFLDLIEIGGILDGYYIPTRYPNGLDDEMAPAEYYDEKDAEKCARYATSILTAVKKYMKN